MIVLDDWGWRKLFCKGKVCGGAVAAAGRAIAG